MVRKLVATPWNIDGRGGVAFRAEAIVPVAAAPGSSVKAASSVGAS
jgi:hypothetical protein